MSDSAGVTEPPNRSTRQKQKTRARLIRAAMSVMAAKGADAATINDITEAAEALSHQPFLLLITWLPFRLGFNKLNALASR